MNRKALLTVVGVIAFALAAWLLTPVGVASAGVNIPRNVKPTGTTWTATPVPPILRLATPPNCRYLTSPVVKQWDFSNDGHESLTNAPGDFFHTTTQYPGVSYDGREADFNDDGIAHTALGIFSPGTQDFSACMYFKADDANGNNILNAGTNSVVDGVHGFFKLTTWGAVVQGTLGSTGGYVASGWSLSLNGSGYHWLALQRTGDTFKVYFDNVLKTTKVAHVGSVAISTRSLSVGGKWYDANPDKPVDITDRFNGSVDWLKLGLG